MLLTLLYHRVGDIKYSNSYEMFIEHLNHLKENYPIVTPGDDLSPLQLQVCLSFDDAYYDFYHYLFPLMKKWKIKAVLSVPVGLIQNSTDLPSHQRLKVSYRDAMNENVIRSKVPYCTWEELKEMAQSGLVHFASHGYHHKNLLSKEIDLEKEIVISKEILEQKLEIPIQTFVYPLGKFDQTIHKCVQEYYTYIMRIGSSFNLNWQNATGVIYRIQGDSLTAKDSPFKFQKWPSYFWFYLLNTPRKR